MQICIVPAVVKEKQRLKQLKYRFIMHEHNRPSAIIDMYGVCDLFRVFTVCYQEISLIKDSGT